jgi:hypothetical protein
MKQEEVYVVVRGSGRMKVDDEIVELKEWDAVRVPPGTWRGIGFIEAPVIGPANIASRPIVPPIAIAAASPTARVSVASARITNIRKAAPPTGRTAARRTHN